MSNERRVEERRNLAERPGLLPCPFCGRQVVSSATAGSPPFRAMCARCGAKGPPGESRAETVVLWNAGREKARDREVEVNTFISEARDLHCKYKATTVAANIFLEGLLRRADIRKSELVEEEA